MNALLTAFILGGGESVIRGILSNTEGTLVIGGQLSEVTSFKVESVLRRKGYPVDGFGPDLAGVILTVAVGVDLVRSIPGRRNRTPVNPADLPVFPGGNPDGRGVGQVVIVYRLPGEPDSPTVIDVPFDQPTTPQEIIDRGIRLPRVNPNSPPPPGWAEGEGAQVVGARIISLYQGVPF